MTRRVTDTRCSRTVVNLHVLFVFLCSLHSFIRVAQVAAWPHGQLDYPHDRKGGDLVFCSIKFWLNDSNFLQI